MSQGQLYLPGKAECLPVRLTTEGEVLFVYHQESNELLYATQHNEIHASSKLVGVPRELTLPDRALIIVTNAPVIDQWIDTKQGKKNRVAWMEGSRMAVLLSLILVPLTLFATFKFAIPTLAVTFADWVPNSVTEMASEHTLLALDKSLLNETQLPEKTQQEYLGYWHDMMNQLSLQHSEFNIQFRYSEEFGPNAFALPDGTMVITDQLVELVNNDINLLTAILLHEIGHVQHKHSMRLIAETLGTTLMINLIFGDVSALVELFGGFTSTVIQNQFSQELEWEADNYALQHLSHLGLEKESFALAMESLAQRAGQENSNLDQWLSSHPSISERIENARN